MSVSRLHRYHYPPAKAPGGPNFLVFPKPSSLQSHLTRRGGIRAYTARPHHDPTWVAVIALVADLKPRSFGKPGARCEHASDNAGVFPTQVDHEVTIFTDGRNHQMPFAKKTQGIPICNVVDVVIDNVELISCKVRSETRLKVTAEDPI